MEFKIKQLLLLLVRLMKHIEGGEKGEMESNDELILKLRLCLRNKTATWYFCDFARMGQLLCFLYSEI